MKQYFDAAASAAAKPRALTVLAAALVLAGCNSGGGDGSVVSYTDSSNFSLYSANVGIATDTSVLSDPNNQFSAMSITADNVAAFERTSTTSAKDRFYLWATALAKAPAPADDTAEVRKLFQYEVAQALHEIFDETGNASAQEQAKRAYLQMLTPAYFNEDTGAPAYAEPFSNLDITGATVGNGCTGTTVDTAYAADTYYQPVIEVSPHTDACLGSAASAAVKFSGYPAGFAADSEYENLVFKVRGLPDDQIKITMPGATGGDDGAVTVSIGQIETIDNVDYELGFAVSGTVGWSQFVVPMSLFGDVSAVTDVMFSLEGAVSNVDTFLITDIGFSGAHGNADNNYTDGLSGDLGDGLVSFIDAGRDFSGVNRTNEFSYGVPSSGLGWLVEGWSAPSSQVQDPVLGQVTEISFDGDFDITQWATFFFDDGNYGWSTDYDELRFKIKSEDSDYVNLWFNFADERGYPFADYGTEIPNSGGWYQMVIPLNEVDVANRGGHIVFRVYKPNNVALSYSLTDVGFAGGSVASTQDTVGDGVVALYKSNTVQLDDPLYRNQVGYFLVEPDGLENLYGDSASALTALNAAGFSYNTSSNQLSALP